MKRAILTSLIIFAAVLCAACGGDDGSGAIPDPGPNQDPANEPEIIAFDDSLFEAALIDIGVDTDGDDKISEEEAAVVETIDISGRGNITSLAELSYFTDLQSLNCNYTGIKQLDVTTNSALEVLDCSYTDIGNGTRAATDVELDISKNPKLKYLNASGTLLTKIDLSKNEAIETINASGTSITEIDISNNTAVKDLDVSGTSITEIDLSKNEAIETINASGTSITEIDISNNTAMKDLNVSGTSITEIDLSKNEAIETVDVSNTDITQIDLSNNSALKSLDVSSTSVTDLDTTSNKELTELSASDCDDLTEVKYDPDSLDSSNITTNNDSVLVPVEEPMETIKDNEGVGSY